VRTDALALKAIMAIIDKVLKRFDTPTLSRDTARTQQELAAVDRQIANLVTAIAQGQGLAPLLDALKRGKPPATRWPRR
jgi:hypothetical protein